MSWTPRTALVGVDSLNTYDSPALFPANYSAGISLGCNDEMVTALIALKGSGVAFVQSAGNASSLVQAFTAPNAAGNCIVVDVAFNPNAIFPSTMTCTDSQGNTYTQIYSQKIFGGDCQAASFVAFGVRAGANTVTVNFTGGTGGSGPCIAIHEYSGASAVDTFQVGQVVSSGTSNLSVTTSQNFGLLHLTAGIVTACPGSPTVTGPSGGVIPQAWLVINEPVGGYTDQTLRLYMGEGHQNNWTLELRQRGTATIDLDIRNIGDTYQPTRGAPIFLFDQTQAQGYILVFAGIIQDWTSGPYFGPNGLHRQIITAVSLESVFDTVYATPVQYVNQTCGAIVADLFSRFETGCPVSLGTISGGTTIPLFNTNYEKLSDLFNQLATTSGFTWYVDPATLQLFFSAPSLAPAPFVLSNTDVLMDPSSSQYSLTYKLDGADYRNRQAVRLSDDAFPHSKEFFVGAGQLTVTLKRPVKQVTNAWATLSTCNTATGSFSGQPSPGDTITIGPANQSWQSGIIYATGGVIVDGNGFVQKITFASGLITTGGPPVFSDVTGGTVNDSAGNVWTCQGALGLSTGQQTYTFVASLDNTQFGQVLIGGTLAATVQNLADAINATAAVRGSTFSLPTWENAQVNAISATGTGFTAQQKSAGTGWVAQLSSVSAAFSWSSATTTGGTSPQGSLGPGEGATIDLQVYAVGTSTAAPGLAYQEGSAVLTLATPLNVGSNLNVEYTREDGNVIEVENTALVTSYAATTHGTGKVQQITDYSQQGLISTSAAAGLQYAQELLAAYEIPPSTIEFQCYRPGLTPGQLLQVNLSRPPGDAATLFNGFWVLQRVEAEMIPCDPWLSGFGHFRYTVTAVDLNEVQSDFAFWEGLANTGGGGGSGAPAATSGGSTNTPGTGVELETNGTDNGVQTKLNLIAGSNVSIANSGGDVTISASPASTLPLARSYSTSWSAQTSVTVTHNLNSTAVQVQAFDGSGNVVQPQSVTVNSVNVVTLTFGAAFTGSVVVIAFGTSVTPPPNNYETSWTAQTSVTVTHNLGTLNVLVMVLDGSANRVIPQNVQATSVNAVVLTFGAAFTGSVIVAAIQTSVRQFNASWTGQTSVTVNHNLGITSVVTQVYDASGNQVIPQNILVQDASNVVLTFGAAFTGSAVIMG